MDFVIGGVSGIAATVISNPFDVIKTRLQLQGELSRTHQLLQHPRQHPQLRYRGTLHAAAAIARAEGVVALQRGLMSSLAFGFTMNFVRLGLFRTLQSRGWTAGADGLSAARTAACSCVSGAAAAVLSNPAAVVKTRLQAMAHHSIAVGRQHHYKGTLDAIRQIWRVEGWRGYFAGTAASCARIAVGSTAQLTTYSKTTEYLRHQGLVHSELQGSVLAGLLTTMIVMVVETPLDVVNTRLLNDGTGKEGSKYKGVMDCIRKVYIYEGPRGFYKGLGPLYLRIAPHSIISLVIWDKLNSMKNGDNKDAN